MADVHDEATRSRNMAAIGAGNTKPELIVRTALHALGLRYRLHCKGLPGTPDIVFPRYRAVVFINGCFWHRHECQLFKWPAKNETFWRGKLAANVTRDIAVRNELRTRGWRIADVWECALRGKARLNGQEAMFSLATWIRSGGDSIVLRGKEDWSDH